MIILSWDFLDQQKFVFVSNYPHHNWVKKLMSSPESVKNISLPFSEFFESDGISISSSPEQIHWQIFKNLFSRTTGPISTNFGTKHRIQVCSNVGLRPFPRGDNYEIVKIHWRNLKIFFSRTTEPISIKLGTKHPWVKGIQVCSNNGPRLFPRGDNYEIVKIHWRN